MNSHPVPRDYRFLPGTSRFGTRPPRTWKPYSAVIVLDCGDARRASGLLEPRPPVPVVNIDHHATNPGYGDLNLVVPDACSTAEIVHGLAVSLGVRPAGGLAEALYTGILTDTGSFRHGNATPRAFRIASLLVGDRDRSGAHRPGRLRIGLLRNAPGSRGDARRSAPHPGRAHRLDPPALRGARETGLAGRERGVGRLPALARHGRDLGLLQGERAGADPPEFPQQGRGRRGRARRALGRRRAPQRGRRDRPRHPRGGRAHRDRRRQAPPRPARERRRWRPTARLRGRPRSTSRRRSTTSTTCRTSGTPTPRWSPTRSRAFTASAAPTSFS